MQILIVDDEIAILEHIEKLLAAEGHNVRSVLMQNQESVTQILTLLAGNKFDAAIVDIVMPVMDGVELAQRVRKLAPQTRIVVCERSLDIGPQMVRTGQADAVLFEPFELADLRDAVGSPESPRIAQSPSRHTDMGSSRILIADHEPPIASLVAGILTQDGYHTHTEQSSSDAIQNAGLFGPSLLIIDPVMPGLSGVEVATRISTQTKCKVLFLTTLASDNDFRELMRGLRQQGCDCEALPKPFSKEQLIEHVHRRVGQAVMVTESVKSSAGDPALTQETIETGSQSAHAAYIQKQGEYDALLNISTPNLYHCNAFRIMRLTT
jgi:CheY-like chemotaxis protein